MQAKYRRIPPEDFAARWNLAKTPEAAAAALGISVESACRRAEVLRRKGYRLQKFRRGPRGDGGDPTRRVRVRVDLPPETVRLVDALASLAGQGRSAWLAEQLGGLIERLRIDVFRKF